jgi:hypothetical protein
MCPARKNDPLGDKSEDLYLNRLSDSSFHLSVYVKKDTLCVAFVVHTYSAMAISHDLELALSSPLAKRILALVGCKEYLGATMSVAANRNKLARALRNALTERVKKCRITSQVCPALSPATLEEVLTELL